MTRYFDSSALAKLVVDEAESKALRSYLDRFPDVAITSVIGVPEVGIAVSRVDASVGARAISVAGWLTLPGLTVTTAPLTASLAQAAAKLGAQLKLRALDAIHLATADAARETLREVVTYDKAMIAACQTLNLPAVSPGA